MPRVFPMGHRRRGAGLTTDSLRDIARALVLTQFASQTWYVNASATAGGSGDSWGAAFTTLQAAVTASLAGDVILIAPGHTENITAAATAAISKSLTILGVGQGRKRPVFTWTTATTATITVAGSSVWIENCVFVANFASLVTMFAVTGDDVTFAGCEFDHANATNQALLGITVTGVDRFSMLDCFVHGSANAGTTNFVQIVGAASKGDGFQFISNTFTGNYTTTLGPINNITVLLTNFIYTDNVSVNKTAAATKNVVLLTGSTGIFARNMFGQGSGAAPITADAAHRAGNATVAAVNTDGSAFI